MHRSHSLWIAVALAGTPGCYLFNGLGGGAEPSLDASLVGVDSSPSSFLDTATDVQWPTPVDASSLLAHDVWYPDSGPPLPREPEPDPGPDGRPSDDPGDDWVDPPPPGGVDDPCCTLSEPVRVTSRIEGMSLAEEPPLIAWRPGRFALAVTRYFERSEGDIFRIVVYELNDDGSRAGEALLLDAPPRISSDRSEPRSLRWAAGRWALAATGDGTLGAGRQMHVRLFDMAWTPASTWLPLGDAVGVDLAYLPRGDGWLAFTSSPEVMLTTPFDELNGVGDAIASPLQWSMSVRAASFRSRAAVVPISGETEADFLVVDADGVELGRVPRGGTTAAAGGMAALRDLAVLAVRQDEHVEVEVLDPFTLAHTGGPTVLGEVRGSSDRALVHSVDVAGSSKFGVAGVCWGVPGAIDGRGDEESQIMFRLVGPDGVPRGAAVTLVSSVFRGGMAACTVGTDDRGFLVGWWNGSELWVRRVDVAA